MDYLKDKVNLKDKRHLLALLGILIIFLAIPIWIGMTALWQTLSSQRLSYYVAGKVPTYSLYMVA